MINSLTLYKPKNYLGDSFKTKIYFPEFILKIMDWDLKTPLQFRYLSFHSGIILHKDVIKNKVSIFLKTKSCYTSPYLELHLSLKSTPPIVCSVIMDKDSYPKKLSIQFPNNINIFWMTKTKNVITI